MKTTSEHGAVFGRPGGEACVPSRQRPIDLVHLARQTSGDRELECEVLAMFVHQLAASCNRLEPADCDERRTIAHTIKGSARAIGAFAIADCAAELESRPEDKALHEKLFSMTEDVREFVAAINR